LPQRIVEAKKRKLMNNAGAILQEKRESGYWIVDAIIEIVKKQAADLTLKIRCKLWVEIQNGGL
jgi:hypothetical protein